MVALVLWSADPDGDFVVCMDARKEGLGGDLLQDDHAIYFELRKLKEHEQNYPTHDLELEAIIHGLKMWRHYLMGRKFLLKTDNMSLKYFIQSTRSECEASHIVNFLE